MPLKREGHAHLSCEEDDNMIDWVGVHQLGHTVGRTDLINKSEDLIRWFFVINHVSDPDSIGFVESDPNSGIQKWPHKKGKSEEISCAECSCHWSSLNLYFNIVDRHVLCSVADPDPNPDPPDPHVFGPPGSGPGSISQRYGSGSCSGSGSVSFYHLANLERKTFFLLFCDFFFTFYLWKIMLKVVGNEKVGGSGMCQSVPIWLRPRRSRFVSL